MTSLRATKPLPWAAAVALLACATSWCVVILDEPASGRIEGSALIAGSGVPVSNASVSLAPVDSEDALPYRSTRTRPDGSFTLAAVAAGQYRVSVVSQAHGISDLPVVIEEGRTSQLSLGLRRTRSPFQASARTRVFSTDEAVAVNAFGYLARPSARHPEPIKISLTRLDIDAAASSARSAGAMQTLLSPYGTPSDTPKELRTLLRSVETRSTPVSTADREGFFERRIGLGRRDPGVYIAHLDYAGQKAIAVFEVTDLALIVQGARGRTVAFAVGLIDGRACPGATVTAFRRGEPIAQARTQESGLAELPHHARAQLGSAFSERTVYIARNEQHHAIVLDYGQSFDSERYRLHMQTDRTVYRPGHEVCFKGIVRRVAGPGPSYTVPAGARVSVRVEDPQGVRLHEETCIANELGSFSGRFALTPETPTGACTIFTGVEGSRFAHDVTVAAYRKPEFEVKAEPTKPVYINGETMDFAVSANYYHGAPVASARVRYYAYWSPVWEWSGAGDDGEDDAAPWWAPPELGQLAAEGLTSLDEQGRCHIRIPADAPFRPEAPPSRSLSVTLTVTDGAGRTADAESRAEATSGSLRVRIEPEGYVIRPGRMTQFRLAVTDLQHLPRASARVSVEFQREHVRPGGTAYKTIGATAGHTGPDGVARVDFAPTQVGELRVVATAVDPEGRTVGAHMTVWVCPDGGGNLGGQYPDLGIYTDKRKYRSGDTARLLINTSRPGVSALVTVGGERLHAVIPVRLTSRSTVVDAPIRPEYGRDVYFTVCTIRNKRFAQSEVGARVFVPGREVRVLVHSEQPTLRPGGTARLTVRTTGETGDPVPAEFSLAVVDEAIYALKEDDPRAAMDTFYPRLYNTVSTVHSCRDVLLSGDKAAPSIEARRRFRDTAFWAPHIRTGPSGVASIEVALPDNLTRWRATAVAHTAASQFGYGKDVVTVTKPLHVSVAMPRFATEGDAFRIVAPARNETDATLRLRLRIEARGLDIEGPAEREMTASPRGTAQAEWTVTARQAGAARVRVLVWTMGRPEPKLTDGVELPLPVRPLARDVIEGFAGTLGRGQTAAHTLAPIEGAQTDASVTTRALATPLAALGPALEYLTQYPYGCVEQTVSAFLPALVAERLLQSSPADLRPTLGKMLGSTDRNGLNRRVLSGISRLRAMQRYGSGWGWWASDPSDAWLTAYALIALGAARQEGHRLPDNMVDGAIDDALRLMRRAPVDTRAFVAYALALHGRDERRAAGHGHGAVGLASLALASRALGRPASEVSGFQSALAASVERTGGLTFWRPPANSDEWTVTSTTALALRALAGGTTPGLCSEGLRTLMLARGDGSWISTRDTAWVLWALCDLADPETMAAAPGRLTVTINGRPVHALVPSTGDRVFREQIARGTRIPLRPGVNALAVSSDNGHPFYSVTVRRQVRGRSLQPISSIAGASVARSYAIVEPQAGLDGRSNLRARPLGGSVAAGSVIRVRLTVRTPRALPFVLLEDPMPANLEPSARGDISDEWNAWYSASEVRDDRVVFFARRVPAGAQVIDYYVRAQTPGRCTALPARAMCMYAPEQSMESGSAVVEVR